MDYENVMIDLETLGTHSDSVILSIGAVKFDLNSDRLDDQAFHAMISIDSCQAAGRTISEATLMWWFNQSLEAQTIFAGPKESLEAALEELTVWFDGDSRKVWSKGADFDLPMLCDAYHHFGWDAPWKFFNTRCVRTYQNLPCAKGISVANALKHDALQDAIAQTRLVQAIQRRMVVAHPMVKA